MKRTVFFRVLVAIPCAIVCFFSRAPAEQAIGSNLYPRTIVAFGGSMTAARGKLSKPTAASRESRSAISWPTACIPTPRGNSC